MPPRPTFPRGQILVLAALLMVLLIGFTGLAIDVSAAYMADRWQRAVADAAALAGGQDLQKPGSRDLPGATEYQAARQHAMEVLGRQLGASLPYPSTAVGSPCLTSSGCALPGTPYVVSIRTPSPSWVDCQPSRCIQVAVRQPAFGLTFARIFGQDSWNVNVTSVAGRIYEKQYGIVTLRPPKDSRGASNPYEDDLFITGGSKVLVSAADVATNTNAVCSGFSSGSELRLDGGYFVYHYDPYEAWTTSPGRCAAPVPLGSQLTTPVSDPGYPIPTRTGTEDVFLNYLDGEDTSANCAAEQAKVPDEYVELATGQKINDPTKVRVRCFRPGVYKQTLEAKNESGLPIAVLLEPGVYYFDAGVRVQTSLLGGYDRGQQGVALVFKEAKNSSGEPGQFTTTQNTSIVAINFGNLYCPGTVATTCPPLPPDPRCPGSADGRCWATPAMGPQGLVQTPGSKPVLMSVIVVPTGDCPVGPIAPATCNANEHKTLNLSGGGNIFLAGVQYAPEDNATLTGNSGQKAEIGAFWAWTISFNGGSQFTLASALPDVTGVLRLDPACSPSVDVCNP